MPKKYIKGEAGPKNSVIYTDSDGNKWEFKGGTRPWRNTNPGNLVPGQISKRNGAIGKAGGFAVFPDYESGHAALLDSLKTQHGNKSIDQLMEVYAPRSDQNDTDAYIKFIRKQTGVKDDRKVKDFSKAEFEKLWRAIEKMEGWGKREGTIRRTETKAKIIGVTKDKHGTIASYHIESYGWVSKEEGIELALQGKVDAVVATSPHGHAFLHGRPGHPIS